MNIKELSARIGKTGTLDINSDFCPSVEVLDVKVSYGNLRYLVKPVSGSGQVWVNDSRVTLNN